MGVDELDDLFGAFDGQDEEQEQEQQVEQPLAATAQQVDVKKKKGAAVVRDDDNEDDEPKEESRTNKKPRLEESSSSSPDKDDSENDGELARNKKQEETAEDPTTSTTIDATSNPTSSMATTSATNFSSIMSQSTVSLLTTTTATTRSTHTDHNKNKKKNATTTTTGGNREIATGTSHDKSVRSYTAMPKNLPLNVTNTTTTTTTTTTPADVITEPFKTYSFPLDPFQQQAISYIEKDESVLVAAHTSAGKTAVAEYAIAKALKLGQRVVYTSPIKALSNQKFRDLQEEFTHVGLMTGDITINPDAACLVMTTEILRSMLYRGSEIMREVAWVIYDEVHYMRDTERGVVWEESIILLPHKVRFVFLSATIPNASQFADWIADIHHQPCHVVYTNYRPTPLQHYIFPQGGDGLHLVVDETGKFRQQNFARAMATLQSNTVDGASAEALMDSGNGKKGKNAKSKKKGGSNSPFKDLFRIVKLVVERNLNPVIVFSFSKKDCERYALALHQEDYTDNVEKDLVSQVYKNAIEALSEDDCKLPQVVALLPLLKRGIGIHHAGLLPILKEIVEILFAEGLVKILFATETFAIGINMPAKTVVFTNTRKWDGKEMRYVTSGEYIQMSGRAGRRGKDDRGIVIQMVDEKMEPDICKDILYGAPDALNSSYRISYNMLLNLLRVEDVDPEYLLRASFHQFQREAEAPALLAEAESLEGQASQVEFPSPQLAEYAAQYYQMDKQLAATRRRIADTVQRPEYCQRFLQAGRFLDVAIDGISFGWGVVVSCRKKSGTGTAGNAGRLATQALAGASLFTLDVLLNCVDRHFDGDSDKSKKEDTEDANLLWRGSVATCRPVGVDDDKKVVSMRIFTVDLDAMEKLSAVRIFIPQDVTTPEARRKVAISVQEVHKRFPDGLPLLDPVVDLGIKDDAFRTLLHQAETLTTRLTSHVLSTDCSPEDRVAVVRAFGQKNDLLERAKVLRQEARSCQTIAMKDDLKKMKRVLKRLGHVNANGVLQTKGRTACEINTAHELVVVELIFTGVFNDISVEQCVALMSCMTFDERSRDDEDPATGLKSHLLNPFLKLKECARAVVRVEIACGVDLKEDEFVDKFNPGMMEAVYGWCKGLKFVEVQKMTNSFEGTTIRTLRRLEELVRQIATAAKAVGNSELEAKFVKGGELLKRDIVFCGSLYL